MEQDQTEPSSQMVAQIDFAATGACKSKIRKSITVLQHHNCTLALACPALESAA
ncbi:hypothetical protein [Rhizobium sp. LjRoot258]|uniref:hypothetical protein n=1 Tax=Rhizobium sp. LjRoot258 TaxID=3342299 RepID=UPI003ED134DD